MRSILSTNFEEHNTTLLTRHYAEDMETTQVSVNREVDRAKVVYAYNVILLTL